MKKPPKPQKPLSKRELEVENLTNQFLELGFALEHPGVQEFVSITKDYIKGIGSSGIIRFDEYDRHMNYIFSMQPHVESRIVLEYTKKKKPKTVMKDPLVL